MLNDKIEWQCPAFKNASSGGCAAIVPILSKRVLLGIFILTAAKNKRRIKNLAKDIDEYIETFPPEIQIQLNSLREAVRKAAPEAVETIRYQIPTLKLNGILVHFAAFKNHIGFYPTPSGIEAFKRELSEYEVAKGSVKFPNDRPLPLDLIAKIVKYRVEENLGKR